MSAAVTRSLPASAADTATMPVPHPISRNEPLQGFAVGPVRPSSSMAAPVDAENGGANTPSSRSHSRPAMGKVRGRSVRESAARLRSSDRM